MTHNEQLLDAVMAALNQVRNTKLKHPVYRDTYELAAAFEKALPRLKDSLAEARHDEKPNSLLSHR